MEILYSLGAIVAIAAAFAGSFGWTFATNYKNMATEIANLKKEKELFEARVSAYQRMIDRRDAAIKASMCSDQIQAWIKDPDKIPKPFNPHDQLNNLGGNYTD
jgi:hypothetical protein